jgi:hypothetical protein
MFEILELPASSLQKILPKASSRSLVRLLTAYPRTVGHTFIDILNDCVSHATMRFLREEINRGQIPSMRQIREAEQELLKIIQEGSLPDAA